MKRRHLTLRMRLTVSATLLIVAAGIVMLGLMYLFMRYAPSTPFTVVAPDVIQQAEATMTSLPAETLDDGQPHTVTMLVWVVTTAQEILRSLLIDSAIVLAILTIVAAAVSWWWSGRVLRPLTQAAEAVHSIDATTLDKRISWQGPNDEIKSLTDDVDGMLDRLERSFTVQRQFSANASHELITPLSTSQALIDVTLTGDDISDDERDVLTKLQGLGTRSLGTVAALMRFAEADNVPLERDRVEMEPLISDIVDSTTPSAAEHGVTIHWDPDADPVAVDADDALLARALDNLVDNAIVHNLPSGGEVWIHTTTDDTQAVIEIENTGDPLTDEQVASFGQPFYRAAGRVAGDSADPTSGHGLGLALARSIVEAHGGTLVVASREGGGLAATVRLPLASVPDEWEALDPLV